MSTTGYCYYEAARNEIVMRIRLRDQILLSFILSSGALLGIALSGIGKSAETIALAIPFLAFGASILTAVHSCAITNIGLYVDELIPEINKCDGNNDMLPWDSSLTFKETCQRSSLDRFKGNFIILFIPSLFSLLVGWDKFQIPFEFPTDIHSTLWVVGLFTIFLYFYVLGKAHAYRMAALNRKNIQNNIGN